MNSSPFGSFATIAPGFQGVWSDTNQPSGSRGIVVRHTLEWANSETLRRRSQSAPAEPVRSSNHPRASIESLLDLWGTQSASFPALPESSGEDSADWGFRIDPPPSPSRRVRVRVHAAAPLSFEARPDPLG